MAAKLIPKHNQPSISASKTEGSTHKPITLTLPSSVSQPGFIISMCFEKRNLSFPDAGDPPTRMDDRSASTQLSIKTVIYSTDFSSTSENAGMYASMLAHQFDADLLVAHAFVLLQQAMEAEEESGGKIKSQQRQDLEHALTSQAGLFGQSVKRVNTALLEGDPRERIPQLAQQKSPSMIVLGTSGRGRIERGIVGSVAERILRVANVPCFTVGPLVAPLAAQQAKIRRVLYATGLSEIAASGAKYAVGIANAFHAPMEVLHVARAEDIERPEQLSEIQRRFREALDGNVPEYADDIANSSALVEVGSAHVRILERLKETSADLLVLSIRKSSHLWLQSRLSGEFNIIANAPCPVMTITG